MISAINRFLLALSLVGPALHIPAAASTNAVVSPACPRFILPIYPSNTETWDEAIASDMPKGSVLILNLGGSAGDDPEAHRGGPGFAADPQMLQRVEAAQAAGYIVIGYVRTGAAGTNSGPRRNRAYTDQDIQSYRDWYHVDGIFYDEVWADWEYLPYYQALVAYGRGEVPGLQVMNMGATPGWQYAGLADIIGTFEGTSSDFLAWSQEFEPGNLPIPQWGAVIMDVTTEQLLREVLAHAELNGISYVYAINTYGGPTENPYSELPPDWTTQVELVNACH